MAHLYGVLLYYSTNWADYRFTGVSYSRPEFLYYWVYYVGFNAPWFFVPLGKDCSRPLLVDQLIRFADPEYIGLLHDSWSQITSAIVFQRDAQLAAKEQ